MQPRYHASQLDSTVALLAKAQDWLGRLTSGRSTSITAIAREAAVGPWYATRVMYLVLLAPDIVQRIMRGEHPAAITARQPDTDETAALRLAGTAITTRVRVTTI